jgi:beta-hydroxylase
MLDKFLQWISSRDLMELLSLKFILVYLYFLCVVFIHFRGKERLKFGRQLLEHSGFLSPFNSLMYLFSAVPAKPILEVADFPELAPLRENWETIRDEAKMLVEDGHVKPSDKHNDMAFLAFHRRGWKRFYLKWYDDFMPSATELCPRTVELVRAIPNINAAAFTLLPPGAILGRHRDPFAASLRYHLGLITPNSEDCAIWIDGQKHAWKDGEDIVFDETYIHWAKNDTDQTRVIMFCDFTRPLKTRVMRWFNGFLCRHVFKATKSQNRDDEKVGFANRVTQYIYRYKNFLSRCKKRSRWGYYAVKWSFIAGLVYLVLLQGLFSEVPVEDSPGVKLP